MKVRKVLSFVAVALSLIACSERNALLCNYSETDITTTDDEHTVLAGFAARTGLSTTVHHRLYSHCLVIADGRQKVCIISNDMMEISPDLSLEIREAISEKSGLPLDNILLHCIHTHSSPRCGGPSVQPGGTNFAFKTRMVKRVVENAVSTITDDASFVPFRMEVGKTQTSINGNRCEKDGPCDHDVYVARLKDFKGRTMLTVMNLACHPVCMGPRSYFVSSDYSGIAADRLKEEWGGAVMQLTGASGNMDPTLGPKDTAYARECGISLADSILNVKFSPVKSSGKLLLATNVAELPYRIDKVTPEAVRAHADSLVNTATDFPRFARDVRNWEQEILARFNEGEVKSKLEFHMEAVNVDGVIFFFTQGEPFCEYQMEARKSFPGETLFFAGYTNGQNSYLPSEHAFEYRKGYEYEIDQMHVYIKAPYPLSSSMPLTFSAGIRKTVNMVRDIPAEYSIVPQPRLIVPSEGCFRFTRRTGYSVEADDSLFFEVAADFAARFEMVSGISLKSNGGIVFRKVDNLAGEAYRLSVDPERIVIEAGTSDGAYYAVQSICQLLPAAIYGSQKVSAGWTVPCCRIEDAPCFEYRGLLLDCGRYFYEKDDIKDFIDAMAMHKLNMFHWHLTEDQGWRIEIGRYPKLTEVGAWRSETAGYNGEGDGTPHGGFYSQDDIREIVEYARHMHVTVIPEIELPGHSSAAIAAYPFLSCTPDEPKAVATRWGVKEDVYSPAPTTVEFLENVFSEVFDLFPSKYYHFGGDECPKTAWRNSAYCAEFAKEHGLSSVDDIQDWFTSHFSEFLRENGKTVIGWDEILDGPSAQEAVAISYRGHAPAAKAIKRGIRCILAPNRWAYLDNPQTELENDGDFHIFMPLSKVYSYYPEVDSLKDLSRKYIIGFEGCVWGEHIPDYQRVEYMTWPRAAAIAEDAWTARENKDWDSFRVRMLKDFERLDAGEVGYCRSFWDVIFRYDNRNGYPRQVEMECNCPDTEIRYTLDGTEPTFASADAPSILLVEQGTEVRARAFTSDGKPVGNTSVKVF